MVGTPGDQSRPDPDAGRGAPGFRLWPPVAIALPWIVGFMLGHALGLHADLGTAGDVVGWAFIAVFAVWNGWCLLLFAKARTGLLPGQSTTALISSGPYRVSRNPLYVGLLLLYVGCALLAGSLIALLLLPIA